MIDEAFVTTSLTTLVFRKASLVPPIKWNSGMRIGPSRKQDGKYTFMDTAKWLGRTAADLITFPVVSELGTQTPWFKVSGSKVMDASGKLAFEFKVTDHVTDQSVFVNGTELFGLEGAGSNSKSVSTVKLLKDCSAKGGPTLSAGSSVHLKMKVNGELLLKPTPGAAGGVVLATTMRALTSSESPPSGQWDADDYLIKVAPGVDAALVLAMVRAHFLNEEYLKGQSAI